MYAEFAQSYIAHPKMVRGLLRIGAREVIAMTLPAGERPANGRRPPVRRVETRDIFETDR
jgi:hypothetical protein